MKKIIENLFTLQSLEFDPTPPPGTAKRIAPLRAEIPAPILAHYDRLRVRGKKGVSVIRGQVCAACNVQVPRNTILTLMNSEDIQICGNCGRYLCLPEHVVPAVPVEKTRKKPAKRPASAAIA